MDSYRLYCLDKRGHICRADWLQATSDSEAVVLARQHERAAGQCELWKDKQLIAKFEVSEA